MNSSALLEKIEAVMECLRSSFHRPCATIAKINEQGKYSWFEMQEKFEVDISFRWLNAIELTCPLFLSVFLLICTWLGSSKCLEFGSGSESIEQFYLH